MIVTEIPVPIDAEANVPIGDPERLTTSPLIKPTNTPVPEIVAVVFPSYSLFKAVIPVTVIDLVVIFAVNPVG